MSLKNRFKIANGSEDELPLSNCTVPKPEDIELNKWYAFTFSPKDDFAPDDLSDFTGYSKDWQRRIENLWSCHIIMHIEYSQAGRFHFHGLISIQNPIMFYLRDLKTLRSYGDVLLKKFKGSEGPLDWELYCRKLQLRQDGLFVNGLVDLGLKLYYNNRVKKL